MHRLLSSASAIILTVVLQACEKPASGAPRPAPNEHRVAAVSKRALDEADQVAALINPAKLSSLRERGANPRILKVVAILWTAKVSAKDPAEIVNDAIRKIGWEGTAKGRLTADAILRNLEILEALGSTWPEDISEMKRGRSPTVRKGAYTGDVLSVDHIIPRSVAPELDNTIANLELMPLRRNQSKNDTVGQRQRALAEKLHSAGLLNDPGKIR